MSKNELWHALSTFTNEILNDDSIIDEYEFRNLDISEILTGIEEYIRKEIDK